MSLEIGDAIVVDFPLRGEWWAINTPAHRVPSHGTDYFGQRYAFDFARMDESGTYFQPRGILRHLVGMDAAEFYAWDQPIHAAFAGRVVSAGDGWPDRARVSVLRERLLPSPPVIPQGTDYRPLAGNFVIVEGDPGVALYAHLRNGSLRVQVGDVVAAGAVLGTVGNSGNSTMPHLHFHVMDGPDPYTAAGRLCAFRAFERYAGGQWLAVNHGVPGRLERIRAVAPA